MFQNLPMAFRLTTYIPQPIWTIGLDLTVHFHLALIKPLKEGKVILHSQIQSYWPNWLCQLTCRSRDHRQILTILSLLKYLIRAKTHFLHQYIRYLNLIWPGVSLYWWTLCGRKVLSNHKSNVIIMRQVPDSIAYKILLESANQGSVAQRSIVPEIVQDSIVIHCRRIACRRIACRGIACRGIACKSIACRSIACRSIACRSIACNFQLIHNGVAHKTDKISLLDLATLHSILMWHF